MGRKKRDDIRDGGVTVADQTAETPVAEVATGPPTDPQAAPKQRPATSFAAMSDRTTRIEVAVWARQVKVAAKEEYTQYALTIARSWRDGEGSWSRNDFHRAHDVPVLLFLVQQAYHWCLAQRTDVRVVDEPLPF